MKLKKLILSLFTTLFLSCTMLTGPMPKTTLKESVTISFSLPGGNYTGIQKLFLKASDNGEIRYTLGTDPNCSNSFIFTTDISINESQRISAISCKNGVKTSSVFYKDYVIDNKVATPEFLTTSPGIYEEYRNLQLLAVPTNSSIYYTMDGSAPGFSSCGGPGTGSTILYDRANINLTTAYNIRAVACASSMIDSDEATGDFNIVILHVSTTGIDTNDGAINNPLLTISEAMSRVNSIRGSMGNPDQHIIVKVSAGTYIINMEVNVRKAVSMLGGFNSTYTARNFVVNKTIIEAVATISGPIVFNDTNAGKSSVLDGFYVLGGGGPTSYGVLIEDSVKPIIRNNFIYGGAGASSYGIHVDGTTNDPTPKIYNNFIHGGVGATNTRGINLSSMAAGIINEVIIRNNTIYSGDNTDPASQASAIFLSVAYATIQNNIIFCSNTTLISNHEAIESGGPPATDSNINNNNFYNYAAVGPTNTVLGTSTANVHDNFAVNSDAIFFDLAGPDNDMDTILDNDWRIKTSAANTFKTGGVVGDSSWNFSDDFFGTTRTGSWSLGAHEQDG